MLELLLPQRCVVCDTRGVQLCETCIERLPRIVPPLCDRCGMPTAWPVRRCRECAGRRLAGAAVSVLIEVVAPPRAEVVTFVPPDPDRGLKRGHHPPRQLAEELARRWELPVAAPLRRRAARRQRGLSRAERRRNVAGVFSSRGPIPNSIVLVDDVFTSGATANAAASSLRKAGARRVDVVTFARVVR